MVQMKEQNRIPEKELNEMQISNLLDAEFKTLVIRMFKELTGYFNNIKKTKAETKVTLSERKKNLKGTNSGMDEAENQINDLEHKEEKKHLIITARRQKNLKISEDRLRSLWDNFKTTNIWIIGVLKEEEKEQ